jgi:hypothetical protein
LAAAAALAAAAGDIRECCELLVAAGQWDRALALAPGVSLASGSASVNGSHAGSGSGSDALEYWRQLARRRATQLAAAGDDDAVALLVAAGDAGAAADFYAASGDMDAAFRVTAAHAIASIGATSAAVTGGDVAGGIVHPVAASSGLGPRTLPPIVSSSTAAGSLALSSPLSSSFSSTLSFASPASPSSSTSSSSASLSSTSSSAADTAARAAAASPALRRIAAQLCARHSARGRPLRAAAVRLGTPALSRAHTQVTSQSWRVLTDSFVCDIWFFGKNHFICYPKHHSRSSNQAYFYRVLIVKT